MTDHKSGASEMDDALTRVGYWPCWEDHQTEWAGKVSPKEVVDQLVEGKIQVLHWGVPERYYFKHKSLWEPPPAMAESGRDIPAEAIEAARRAGIKIVLGIPISRFCINDPVKRADFISYCGEFARRYDIDGIIIDGPFIDTFSPRVSPNTLECEHCRNRYRGDTGHEPPAEEDWNSPDWKRYVRWCGRHVNEFLKEMRHSIKTVTPHVPISINSYFFPLGGWTTKGDTDTFHECVDNIFIELYVTGNSLLYADMQIKLARALTEGRKPEGYHKTSNLVWAEKGHLACGRPSYIETATLAYIILANGASLSFHSSMDDQGRPHPERTAVYQQLGREIDGRSEWLVGAEPAPEVALHFGQNTKNFYAGADMTAFGYTALGAGQMMLEAQIGTGCVLDHQLDAEHLKDFSTLLLPNSACLSEAQAAAVRTYVQEGGGLLATGETSLYDEDGNLRQEFALADVLGITYQGVNPKVAEVQQTPILKRYPFHLRPHEIVGDLEKIGITYLPWFAVSPEADREILATWCDAKPDTGWNCVNGGLEIAGDSGIPLILIGTYGKGRVCYISSDITANYAFENAANTRNLIASIMRWIAPPQIEIIAPKCVVSSVCTQKGRRVIHLVNYSASSRLYQEVGGFFGYFRQKSPVLRELFFSEDNGRKTPRKDIPDEEMARLVEGWNRRDHVMPMNPIDEVVPVFDIEIRVRDSISNAYLAPERRELEIQRQGDYSVIRVPRVDIHTMVVVE